MVRQLFWAWLVLITVLSLIPDMGDVSGGWTVPQLDKLVHFTFYLGFTVLGVLWYLSGSPVRSDRKSSSDRTAYIRLIFIFFLIAGGYGIVIETLQGVLTATRKPEGADIIANLVGALAGSLISYTSFPVYQTLINKLAGSEIERKY